MKTACLTARSCNPRGLGNGNIITTAAANKENSGSSERKGEVRVLVQGLTPKIIVIIQKGRDALKVQ